MSRAESECYLVPAFALGSFLLAAACSSPPPAPPKEPATPDATAQPAAKPAAEQEIPKEPVDSGMACAKAEAQCGGGVCAVKMENTCDKPITCDIAILTVCQAETDLVQAKAKRRETFAEKVKASVSVAADCASARIVSTKVQSLACK